MTVTYLSELELQNWNGRIRTTPKSVALVDNLTDLTRAVHDAEGGGDELKASGSRWSFTDAPFSTDTMLLTNGLRRVLSVVKADTTFFGPSVIRDGPLREGRAFAHAECGTTVRQLANSVMLPPIDLALPTAGGGSSGQTLAGLISTGSHGGDYNRSSILEWIRAIHLVGPRGRHFWIERSAPNHVASEEKLENLTGWSSGTEIVRDDDTFFAALVSCGRMGIIYSLIVELVEPYSLRDKRVLLPWDSLRDRRLGRPVGALFDELRGSMGFSRSPHFLSMTVTLDPFNRICYAQGRELIDDSTATPKYDLRHDLLDELIFQHSDWIGVLDPPARIGYELNGKPNGEIRAIQNFVLGKALQPYEFQGPWWHVMFDDDSGLRVLSAEYAFDATTPRYLEFITEVRERAAEPLIPGTLTLRFLPAGTALLCMQSYEETVHLEISVPVGYDPGPAFFRDIDRLARQAGAIPHWGQLHDLEKGDVRRIFGERLFRWRRALNYLTSGGDRTFSNDFTRRRGLEPSHRDYLLFWAAASE